MNYRIKYSKDNEVRADHFVKILQEIVEDHGLKPLGVKPLMNIMDFLIKEFPWTYSDDLKDAFDKQSSGKLNIDASTYGSFTKSYVGKVLKAYRAYQFNLKSPINQAKETDYSERTGQNIDRKEWEKEEREAYVEILEFVKIHKVWPDVEHHKWGWAYLYADREHLIGSWVSNITQWKESALELIYDEIAVEKKSDDFSPVRYDYLKTCASSEQFLMCWTRKIIMQDYFTNLIL